MPEADLTVHTDERPAEVPESAGEYESPRGFDDGRRRFTKAALIGLAIATVPYLWVLWDRRPDPLHRHPGGFFTNFYDLQARALFDGHWHVPKGSLGIEAFVVDGRHYTYFPPFPSLLRMPVLAVTDVFDGRLTAPSMLLSWLVTGLFASLLLWRVRILLRGAAPVSRGEAVAVAAFLATVMSGSVLLYLAALPWVYHEAFAWGAAMTIGALFALLGVLERPSAARVAWTGALTLAAVLSRTTIGWGAVLAAVVAAVWFASGRGGDDNRRWWLPVLMAGLVPFAVGCLVTWMKFGTLFMHPLSAQVWTKVNAHRREALDANGGTLVNVRFLPTTALAYFRPDGLRLSAVFPYITLPATPPNAVGDVVVDQTYRTASVPTTMPLLFLLSVWGTVTSFGRGITAAARSLRIPLIGAFAGTAGVLFYGYIAPRYLGDFLPVLVLGGAVGLVELWRRVEGWSGRARRGAVAAVAALAAFGVVAHLGISTQTSQLAWEGERVRDYIELQKSVSDATAHPLDGNIERGEHLPRSAPADQLFVVDDCAGLYISTGEQESPRWLPVERGPGLRYNLEFTYHEFDRGPVTLVTVGNQKVVTLSMEDHAFEFTRWMRFRLTGLSERKVSRWVLLRLDEPYRVSVAADTELGRITVTVNGDRVVDERLPTSPPVVVRTQQADPDGPPLAVTVRERHVPRPSLCRDLTA